MTEKNYSEAESILTKCFYSHHTNGGIKFKMKIKDNKYRQGMKKQERNISWPTLLIGNAML